MAVFSLRSLASLISRLRTRCRFRNHFCCPGENSLFPIPAGINAFNVQLSCAQQACTWGDGWLAFLVQLAILIMWNRQAQFQVEGSIRLPPRSACPASAKWLS